MLHRATAFRGGGKMKMTRWLPELVSVAALAAFPLVALAQEAPPMPKQVRIVIASVPGAGPDFISRLMAPKLSEALRSNVIVENRPGTNGIVAAQFTAKSAPDGSVLMMGNAGTHAI